MSFAITWNTWAAFTTPRRWKLWMKGKSGVDRSLFRSGNLHNATPPDLEGVSEIIDFRTNLEEEKMPDMIPIGVFYRRIPVFNESAPIVQKIPASRRG